MNTKIGRRLFWLVLTCTLKVDFAQAFPENIRHGYVNCNACHVSPTGGGLVTEYGRNLSKELLSSNAFENEQKSFYSITPPKWLLVGGDVRAVETYRDTRRNSSQNFIPMQFDLEVAALLEKFTAVATLGVDKNPNLGDTSRGISRRHYMMYEFSDSWFVRAGRFGQAYGLNIPEHIFFIKRLLGFDENQETYNLEMSYLGEFWNLFLTGNAGRPDDAGLTRDTGGSGQIIMNFGEANKIGLSVYSGRNQTRARSLLGVSTMLGFSKQWYLLGEFDFQQSMGTGAKTSPTNGLVSFARLGYEIIQGFHLSLVNETAQLNLDDSATKRDGLALAAQWLPRPHLDLEGLFGKYRNLRTSSDYFTSAFLMGHFYF